jgi:hypothetical protein
MNIYGSNVCPLSLNFPEIFARDPLSHMPLTHFARTHPAPHTHVVDGDRHRLHDLHILENFIAFARRALDHLNSFASTIVHAPEIRLRSMRS